MFLLLRYFLCLESKIQRLLKGQESELVMYPTQKRGTTQGDLMKNAFLFFGVCLFILCSCEAPFEHRKYETEYAEDTVINISQIIGPNGPMGYVYEWAIVQDGLTREVYRVYDINEIERGFILEHGETYLYDKEGNPPIYLNQYDLETGVRFILNTRERIQLVRPTTRPWKAKELPKAKKVKEEEEDDSGNEEDE